MKDHHRMRAWDGAKMWQYARYTLDGTRVEVSDQANGCNNDWRGHNECIVELCTGLRDKNGTLIYEGDIVRCRWVEGPIRYESGVFTLVGSTLFSFNREELEITVNIHQN